MKYVYASSDKSYELSVQYISYILCVETMSICIIPIK